MTDLNPTSGKDAPLPTIRDCFALATTLRGLIAAMDAQVGCIGPDGDGLFACIDLAKPIAKQLVDAIDRNL